MKPAVEWISSPRRPSDDLPSTRPTRSFGHGDAFVGGAQHELAGMEDERVVAVLGDLDQLGEVDHVLLDVDDAAGVVAEHAEQVRDAHVDR